MSRYQQRIGKAGEDQAANTLSSLGIGMVEKIGTPIKIIGTHPRDKEYVRIVYGEKVSGDHRGVMNDGRSVLVETKTVIDDNLSWSHLRDHQPTRLSTHAELQGLTLLTWVHHSGIYVMQWEDVREAFGPRHPLTPKAAEEIDQHTRALLYEYSKARR